MPQPLNNHADLGDRRHDIEMRAAVNRVQKFLYNPNPNNQLFSILLQQLMHLTHSDYGAICTGPFNKSLDKCSAHIEFNIIQYEDCRPLISMSSLKDWADGNILPLQSIYFNKPFPACHTKLILKACESNALCIIPIINANKHIAVCVLTKQSGTYNEALIKRLSPLIKATSCVLLSAQTLQKNKTHIYSKIANQGFLQSLLSSALHGVLVIDQEDQIIFSNKAARKIFFSPLALSLYQTKVNATNEPFADSIHAYFPGYERLFQYSNTGLIDKTHAKHWIEPKLWENQSFNRINGEEFFGNVSVFRHAIDQHIYTTLQIHDVSATNENMAVLSSQKYRAITHLVPVAIIHVDINWNCVLANDKWYEFTGLSEHENMGNGWINGIYFDDLEPTLVQLRASLLTYEDLHTELRLLSHIGEVHWVELNTRALFNQKGALEGFIATFTDITERLQHQEKLRFAAENDSLTGLANKGFFHHRLEQAFNCETNTDKEIVIFFLDLDGFKDVNDTIGHCAGDELLRIVSKRLLNTLRADDTVARFGGDEFAILFDLFNDKNNTLSTIAQKIIDSISKPYTIDNHEVYVTTSIGIAIGTRTKNSPELLLKQADSALYLAKSEGKNNFQFFNPILESDTKSRVNLCNKLRSALKNNLFFLVYQPQALTQNEKIIGFEALIRLRDIDGKIILPDEFIPILENSGLILQVGKWIIEQACQQLSQWKQAGLFPENGFLSINVSPKQLLDSSFLSVVSNACQRYHINPSSLIIEITETVTIDKPGKVIMAMSSLKTLGVKFALDDFGTGYSSLSYLQKFPFDHIKIDKSFVMSLNTDINSAKIVKALAALSKSLGLKVTAEGVSDITSLNLLTSYGIDFFQGFYLSKPLSRAHACEVLSKPKAKKLMSV